jgi:hypothetical protein
MGTGQNQPVCGLLEIDGVTLLMNSGWNEQFDEGLLDSVIRYDTLSTCLHDTGVGKAHANTHKRAHIHTHRERGTRTPTHKYTHPRTHNT